MTRLYAIIGDPVAQVRSPALFNARFEAVGVDAAMVALHVRQRLAAVLSGLPTSTGSSSPYRTSPLSPGWFPASPAVRSWRERPMRGVAAMAVERRNCSMSSAKSR